MQKGWFHNVTLPEKAKSVSVASSEPIFNIEQKLLYNL